MCDYTCMAAAPRRPQVRNTSEEAATQERPLMKNSLQTVAGNSWWMEPGGVRPRSFVHRTSVAKIGTSVNTYTTLPYERRPAPKNRVNTLNERILAQKCYMKIKDILSNTFLCAAIDIVPWWNLEVKLVTLISTLRHTSKVFNLFSISDINFFEVE